MPEIEQLARDWPMVYDLKLPAASTCVMVGMYNGRASELLQEVYAPSRIVGFDPQLWALEQARERAQRLGCEDTWEFHNYAVGDRHAYDLAMDEWGTDACSLIDIGRRVHGRANMREIGEALERQGVYHIDLFMMNCEAYEYVLLPYMAANNLLARVAQFAVQFHTGHGNALPKDDILALLAPTHRIKVDQYPAWVLFDRAVQA